MVLFAYANVAPNKAIKILKFAFFFFVDRQQRTC